MKLPSLLPRRGARDLWFLIMGVAVPAITLALFFSGGCNDDSRDPRRGLAGDSCLTTNDCVVPLSCVANVCGDGSDGSSSSGSGSGGGGPVPVDGGTTSVCDECLDTSCSTELAACDSECIAVEACIETQCKHLGEIGSDDEGPCFANCQNNHPSGKQTHIAVVDCAQSKSCFPPCVPYPQDYEACRAHMDMGLCAGALAACNASLDCKNYNDCASLCPTAADCIACDDTPEGLAGRELRESYEFCVASECISESWLPQAL